MPSIKYSESMGYNMPNDVLKVIATGPIIRRSDGILLKVSEHAFKADPGKIYELVRSAFWMDLIKHGYLKEVVEAPRKPGPRPKHEQAE